MLAKNASSLFRHAAIWDLEKEDTTLYPGSSISILAIWISIWGPSSELLQSFLSLALQATVWESRSAKDHLCSSTGDFGCLKADGKRESHPHPPPAPSLRFLGTAAFCCMDAQWGRDSKEIEYSGWTRESSCVVKISQSRHIVAFRLLVGKWKL